ncbi:WD40/YVTN/BNR-like repeat-containing protein [Agrococcus sp. DT81.2]|uniref:WD40/YVTN/BNR-like repeat-containing protein n=1 Tax=Agrococcus sp. DT81.2 TaxID=3393414 RepID=UPI003CE5B425
MPTALRRRRVATAAALSALVALTAAACAPADSAVEALAADNHIHRLVPSTDGTALMLGTHNGLFTVDLATGETAGPVGGNVVDLMGLTAADGALLASGHPGASGEPPLQGPNLGFIRSDDGGETWEAMSLAGVADFHSLTYDGASDTFVGAAAGQILTSDDGGSTWRQGAAANPYDLLATESGLLMTSADGLSRSSDGGSSFEPVDGAPPVALLGADGETVTGIEPDGQLWRSGPDGRWTRAGAAPEPMSAMAVLPGGDVVVATASGLLQSGDLGGTWRSIIA